MDTEERATLSETTNYDQLVRDNNDLKEEVNELLALLRDALYYLEDYDPNDSELEEFEEFMLELEEAVE